VAKRREEKAGKAKEQKGGKGNGGTEARRQESQSRRELFRILIAFKRLMEHEVMKPKNR
jgi:hypothetical protein